jgi:hypothetical protein
MSQTVNELVSRLNEIRVRGLYPSYKRDSMSLLARLQFATCYLFCRTGTNHVPVSRLSQTVNELVSRPNEIRVRGLYPSYKRDSMSQTVNELVSRQNEIRVRGAISFVGRVQITFPYLVQTTY